MEKIRITSTEELFDEYDKIINITMVNLYTLSKDQKKIVVSDFDRKSKDHLFILRVALLAKDIYNFPLELDVNFWDWLILNWRMRKLSRRIPRHKGQMPNVNVRNLIEFMYPPIRENLGETFKFSTIYNQFYGKELG